MSEPLGERQGQVLRAIVREYIRSGEPVGSKHLVGRFRLAVSSATVRNDMARLEDLGYLSQPHTSAGRVPTDLAYRHFVDTERPARLGEPHERRMEAAISAEPADLEELLRRASEVLSRYTHYAAAALAPPLNVSRLRRLDVAWLGPRLAVVVLIADGGRVEKQMIELEHPAAEAAVERVGRDLDHELSGLRLDEARRRMSALAARASSPDRELLGGVAEAINGLMAGDQRVVLGGTANLLDERVMEERESLRGIYEALERRTEVLRLLAEAEPPVGVRIGSEIASPEMQSFSVVAAPYGDGAAVGVIGPKRMDYLRAMASVSLVARILEATLRDLTE